MRILLLFSVAKIFILLQIPFVKSENHYKKRKIICLIRNSVDFCMVYSDSFPLYRAYHYILLKGKPDVPTYNFWSWFMNTKIGKISLFPMLIFAFSYPPFWGFSIMLFLICFFCHFITPIGIDYQYARAISMISRIS